MIDNSYTIHIQYTIPGTIHKQFKYNSDTIQIQFIHKTQFIDNSYKKQNLCTIHIQIYIISLYTIYIFTCNLYTIYIEYTTYIQFIYIA